MSCRNLKRQMLQVFLVIAGRGAPWHRHAVSGKSGFGNTGNTGFVMTQLRNLPCDMMTSMTSHDFGCLFLQYNSVADSKSCVCIGSSPGCVFSLTGLNASHEMGGTGPSVA